MIKTAPSRYRLPNTTTNTTTGPTRYVVKATAPPSNIHASAGSCRKLDTDNATLPRSTTNTPIVTILPESTCQQPPSSEQIQPPLQLLHSSPSYTMNSKTEPALTPSQRLDNLIPPQEPQPAPLSQPPQPISRKKSFKNLLKRAHTTRVSNKDKDTSTPNGKRAPTAVPEGYRLIDVRLPSGIKIQQPVNETWTIQNLISAILLANPTQTQSRSLDSDDYMVWEICASLKLRRALRSKELVGHVLTTWPTDDCDWYLELDDAERRLDVNSVASLCPRRDIVSAAAAGAAGSNDNALKYKCIALQRGSRLQRWRKVGIAVNNHDLTLTELSSNNTSTAASPRRYLDLRELDLYEPLAVSNSSAASTNSPYLIGLRVQRNPESFVDPKRDCVHILSFPPEHFNAAEDPAVKAYNTIRNIAFSVRSAEVDQLVKKARLASTSSAHRSKSVSGASGRGGWSRTAPDAKTTAAVPPAPLIASVMASSHPAMPPAAAALAAAAASGNANSPFKPNSLLNKA